MRRIDGTRQTAHGTRHTAHGTRHTAHGTRHTAHGRWRDFLTGILVACLSLGSISIFTQSASARPPCANIAFVPEEIETSGMICIDEWISINQNVHSLLFGPNSAFSLDAPGYRLFAPVTSASIQNAETPSGISFALDVLALAPAGFDEPGGLDNLPSGAADAILAKEVSGGFMYADMIRGMTAVAVSGVYISFRQDNGQMAQSFYVLGTLPFDLAESLRLDRDLSMPPRPACAAHGMQPRLRWRWNRGNEQSGNL